MGGTVVIGMIVGDDLQHLSKNLPFYGREIGFEKAAIVSTSDERVLALLREYDFEIERKSFTNYADQRNSLLALVGSRWLLQLDADERPEPGLLEEVRALSEEDANRGEVLLVLRKNFFMNRLMLHSRQYPDYIPRFFYNENLRYDGAVHERLVHSRPMRRLQGSILHYGDEDIVARLSKAVRYSTIEARGMTRRPRLLDLFLRPVAFFLVSLIRDRAFLDGIPGLVWTIQATICYELKFLFAYYWSWKRTTTERGHLWNG